MGNLLSIIPTFLLVLASFSFPAPDSRKEYLTPQEIAKIQDAREIDKRVKIYLDAGALRLKTAQDRLNGKEAETGDPLEFFRVEEMLEGYYAILHSVMMNLDEASEKKGSDPSRINKSLKNLKDSTEKGAKELAILQKMAEEKQKEELWNLVKRALEITEGAREGAEEGLKRFTEKSPPRKPKP